MVRLVNGGVKISDLDLMLEICNNMVGQTICVLADACAGPVTSFIRKFRPEFEDYIRSGKRLSLTGFKEEVRQDFKPLVPTKRH
jgi:NADH-quinone oxidoreductase subunit F